MHDDKKPEPVDIDMLRRMGYENRDISLGTITKFVIALFIFIGLTGVVTFGVYHVLVNGAWESNKEWPLRTVGELKSIPQPVLQARPVYDMTQFQKREKTKLESQGFATVPEVAGAAIPDGVLQKMEQRYRVPRRAAGSGSTTAGSGSAAAGPAASSDDGTAPHEGDMGGGSKAAAPHAGAAGSGSETSAPAGAGHTGGETR